MEIVNSVYRGELGRKLNLKKLFRENKEYAILYKCKPKQLKITFTENKKGCVLLFETGTFRVMGKFDEIEALVMLHRIFSDTTVRVPDTLKLQTITMSGHLPERVNLYKLSDCISSTYEFELFTALRITAYNPLCVNVFGSGACVITGCKDIEKVHKIFSDLDILCNNNNVYIKDNIQVRL